MQPMTPHKATNTSANSVFFIIGWVIRAATLAHERSWPSIDKLSPAIDFVNYLPLSPQTQTARVYRHDEVASSASVGNDQAPRGEGQGDFQPGIGMEREGRNRTRTQGQGDEE